MAMIPKCLSFNHKPPLMCALHKLYKPFHSMREPMRSSRTRVEAEWGTYCQANYQGWKWPGRVCYRTKQPLESFTQASLRRGLKGGPEHRCTCSFGCEASWTLRTHMRPLKTTSPDRVIMWLFQHVCFLATIKNTTFKKWESSSVFCWEVSGSVCLLPSWHGCKLTETHRLVLQETSRDLVFLIHSVFRSFLSIKTNTVAVNGLHNYARINFSNYFRQRLLIFM